MTQAVPLDHDAHPSAFHGGMVFSAIDFTTDNNYTFGTGNTVTYTTLDANVLVDCYIKNSSDSDEAYYRKITNIGPGVITLASAYQGTTGSSTARIRPGAFRMGGLYGYNELSGHGYTDALRGVVGSVAITGPGDCKGVGIGTRGVVDMDNSNAYMAIGSCFATGSDIKAGELGSWIGFGVESPLMDDYAKVNDEIIGVGVGRLMRLVDHDASIGTNCEIYGLKQAGNERNYFKGYFDTDTIIGYYWDFADQPSGCNVADRANYSAKSVFENEYYYDFDQEEWLWHAEDVSIENLYGFKFETPVDNMDLTEKQAYITNAYALYIEDVEGEGLIFTNDPYGIYQAGNDDNYLGGPLKVDGVVGINEYVNIYNTSSVRAFCSEQRYMYYGIPILVDLDNTTFDTRVEFSTEDHWFEADLDGTYQINACVKFSNVIANSPYQLGIYINGSLVSEKWQTSPTSADFSICTSDMFELSADDIVTMRVTVANQNPPGGSLVGGSTSTF